MSTAPHILKGLHQIEHQMHSMLAGTTPSYDAAWNIYRQALSLMTDSPDFMHPLWLIWGALTDWFENRPEEKLGAESKMRQAAEEWLALNRDDVAEVKTYCDRWIYDEMGYSR